MADSTGISPQASVFGNEQNEGILVAKCVDVNFPGGFVFSTNSAGTINYNFLWVDTAGKLRIIAATPGIGVEVVYNPGNNTITFTAFDQDADGTIVGSQS